MGSVVHERGITVFIYVRHGQFRDFHPFPDFLKKNGTPKPVAFYGQMRRGRAHLRGKFVKHNFEIKTISIQIHRINQHLKLSQL